MTALAIASIFTGAVVFVWGLRALRNGRVKVLFFNIRSWMSTMIFGIVSMLCGILMIIAGPAATSPLTADLADLMAKVSLYLFGVGWVIALLAEAPARVSSKLFPEDASLEDRRKRWRPVYTRASLFESARRLLRTAMILFLLAGSRLYHRVSLPPRSWDKQNLWHGDAELENRAKRKPQNEAKLESGEPRPEACGAKGDLGPPAID